MMGALQTTQPAIETHLREDRFTTLVKDTPEQFPYWQDRLSSIAEVETSNQFGQGFRATMRGHDLGKLHMASLRHDAMKFRRTQQLIRRSDIDHWQIVLRRRGSEISSSGGAILRSRQGSLDLRSLAQPCAANSSRGDVICVWLRRDNFSELAASLDAASHRPIRGVMKNIMQEYILTLDRYRSTLTAREVPVVVKSLTALLNAFVRPSRDGLAEAALPIAASRFEMAKKYIDANLHTPRLGPENLCRELNVSRRKLYYLFERSGGVSKFIRERRLAACHAALEDVSDLRLVSTIAYDYGFTDPAQFSRLFKSHFGYSPKEARELRMYGQVPSTIAPTSFAQWLSQARAY